MLTISPNKVQADLDADSRMRVLANYLIDRVLELKEKAEAKGLNINTKKNILVMEQLKDLDFS